MKTKIQIKKNILFCVFIISALTNLNAQSSKGSQILEQGSGTQSLSNLTMPTAPFVELIFFSCKKVNNEVQLDWRTASEKDNENFIIEKSSDSTNFKVLGNVKGAGKSVMVNDYSFKDPAAGKTATYYRLKFNSSDGHFNYSGIIAINAESSTLPGDPKLRDHVED